MRWFAAMVIATTSPAPTMETPAAPPVSLRGSPAAMQQQHQVAVGHGLTFYQTVQEIRDAVDGGELVEMHGSSVYEVAGFVDLPYLHPAARLFVTRTAAQYYEECGQPLVVTSGVRAAGRQPPNAHALSVHPAGIAVDLRVSPVEECRAWLESKMLALEEEGVINGIREFRPPHYHVAVFPAQYMTYVGERLAAEASFAPGAPEAEEVGRRLLGWLTFVVIAALLLLAAGVAARRFGPRAPAS
jgi:hypothetical protein